MSLPTRPTAAEVAAATPVHRDRYVDFLRAASLAAVVLGHWLMAAVEYRDGRLGASNVLRAVPPARVLTWALQVMPLFFFVGGFANAASWSAARRDGMPYGAWLGSRVRRLVRPAAAYAMVWAVLAAALTTSGAAGRSVAAIDKTVALPLWFLAVYLVVVALAPALLAAHRRLGWAVPVGLAAGWPQSMSPTVPSTSPSSVGPTSRSSGSSPTSSGSCGVTANCRPGPPPAGPWRGRGWPPSSS